MHNSERKKFIELYESGQTLQQIADQFSLTRERVRQVLRDYSVNPRSGGKAKQTRDLIARVKKAHESGLVKQEIAKSESKCAAYIGSILVMHNMRPKQKIGRSPSLSDSDLKVVKTLKEQGMSCRKMSEYFKTNFNRTISYAPFNRAIGKLRTS